jgi:hypothetical protein
LVLYQITVLYSGSWCPMVREWSEIWREIAPGRNIRAEYGGDMFLRNVCWSSVDYKPFYPMHHGTCRIWSSGKIFKSHQLKRKSTDSAPNTGTTSTHIPTTSQFTSRYHQTTGDWDDICPPDFMCKCSLVTLVFLSI